MGPHGDHSKCGKSEPSNKKLDMDGCQVFIDAIRSITDNPTMDRQDCEEWIEEFASGLNNWQHGTMKQLILRNLILRKMEPYAR